MLSFRIMSLHFAKTKHCRLRKLRKTRYCAFFFPENYEWNPQVFQAKEKTSRWGVFSAHKPKSEVN